MRKKRDSKLNAVQYVAGFVSLSILIILAVIFGTEKDTHMQFYSDVLNHSAEGTRAALLHQMMHRVDTLVRIHEGYPALESFDTVHAALQADLTEFTVRPLGQWHPLECCMYYALQVHWQLEVEPLNSVAMSRSSGYVTSSCLLTRTSDYC